MIIELKFSLICELDEECADEVAEDICHDMRCMFHNGEDVYEWLYRGYRIVKYGEEIL